MNKEKEKKTIFLSKAQLQAMYMNGEISLATLMSIHSKVWFFSKPQENK